MRVCTLVLVGSLGCLESSLGLSAVGVRESPPPLARFLEAGSPDNRTAADALAEIGISWSNSYTAMLVDMARLMRAPRRVADRSPDPRLNFDDDVAGRPSFGSTVNRETADDPTLPREEAGSPARRRLIAFLERQTHQSFGDDLNRWRTWMWELPYDPHPEYAAFKGVLYGQLDPRMRAFFPPDVRSEIRLDEVDWGGVTSNGIPPLRNPRIVSAGQANYLKDSNVVFGIVINGEARAYPKRILAWHELATDRIGGVELTIVYCTLCGTVIPFDSEIGTRTFHFGTSGLLYRSNKLMFDEETSSLWSTFEGVPVVGRLVGSGVALTSRPVVTTTWKEWRSEHPDTTALSIDTGYQRDYSEGAAYRDYFATDRLMFQVSKIDARLRNKAEVLVMRLEDETRPSARVPRVPLAIHVPLLTKETVFSFDVAHSRYVVVTTRDGANRVYRVHRSDVQFPKQRGGSKIIDTTGRSWRVSETALTPEGGPSPDGAEAPRVSAQRAFWFGWYAQFPDTILIK